MRKKKVNEQQVNNGVKDYKRLFEQNIKYNKYNSKNLKQYNNHNYYSSYHSKSDKNNKAPTGTHYFFDKKRERIEK